MKIKNYHYTLTFISFTILATIGLQIYWNIKNFAENERQLINEVQNAFDNSVDNYYTEDLKNTKSFLINDSKRRISIDEKAILNYPKSNLKRSKLSLNTGNFTSVTILPSTIKTTSSPEFLDEVAANIKKIQSTKSVDGASKLTDITNKIIISLTRDSVDFSKIKKLMNSELNRKNIQIRYGFTYWKGNSILKKYNIDENLPLKTFSNSAFLLQNQKLQISFSNPLLLVLKRSMIGIILSLMLSLSIIFCLLYLLKTINKQKKIDEMKNDLISNITHEFKTPITTVSTALEGIKSFNAKNDVEKTNRYIDISNQQLKKLEVMVEKLLETASLETDTIQLQKESADIVSLLKSIIEKHQINSNEKMLNLKTEFENLMANIDTFHIENAISNVVENALKYGGNSVNVHLKIEKDFIVVLVEDDGNGIEKNDREKIFEKFYRGQKGNIHDVKGFGIGLYYSRKIIEKHGGKVELIPNTETVFKIMIPE